LLFLTLFILIQACPVKMADRNKIAVEEPDKMKMTMMHKPIAGLIALLLTASPVLAAGDGGGLPQLDFTTWPTQLFWLVVTFVIGYLLMWRVVVPKISVVLDVRRERISSDIESAKQADAEAKAMKADYEAELEDARNKAAEAARQAVAAAKAESDKTEADLAAKLAKKVKTAESKLASAREEALASINDAAQSATIDLVAQITGMKLSAADAKKSVSVAAKHLAKEA
jgi:F-type H+-transporting ATPase subunit b